VPHPRGKPAPSLPAAAGLQPILTGCPVHHQISQKRWKVDTNSRQDSVLMLSAVNLPGGVQRRKQESDELQMRSFFAEGDVLSVSPWLPYAFLTWASRCRLFSQAEVQAFFGDGSMAIHTRSLKYGKVSNRCSAASPAVKG
jgi:exosome complex component RRP4